jgi:hypothetical protein
MHDLASPSVAAQDDWMGLALSPRRPWLWLALLVTAYGGLLRYEAVVVNYSWMGQPAWSAALSRGAVPLARHLRPSRVSWGETRDPYVNGDPINYLRFAREMSHFYQAHVREPVFLAWTRLWLWLSGGRDLGLSFASAAGSTAAIFATYLLGAAASAPLVGLIAAFGLAVEFHAIALSIEGWRDDTFMCVVALAAAALVALRRHPSPLRGVLAGIAIAAACLTRITSLSFVVPTLIWLAIAGRRSPAPRAAARSVAAAALVAAALVAPYLINCARASGDPLLAINYHTRYYRAAEGRPYDAPQSALAYVSGKLAARPIGTIDTAMQGIVSVPFLNKWFGFGHWHDSLPWLLRWPAASGLVLSVFTPTGRLLLLMLLTSIVPYAVTWSLGGGGEWRFTQHAYPFYLVIGAWMVVTAVRSIGRLALERKVLRPASWKPVLVQVAAVLAIVVALVVWPRAMPLLAADEAIRAGEAVSLVAGERDAWVFESGWSDPVAGGVPFRIARNTLATMRVPVADSADFWLTLRVDPPETAALEPQSRLTVYLDRRPVAHLRLGRDPERMGSYRIRVADHPPRTFSRLELVASHTVPARDAGPYFASVPPDSPVAFRLWYVRVDPGIRP